MVLRFGGHPGGIGALRGLIENHQDALEVDLIRAGLRLRWLGTEHLTWRDLLVLVRASPPGSELFHAVNRSAPRPETIDLTAVALLRSIEYGTRWLAWAKTEAGSKGRDAPEPVTLPWDTPTHRVSTQAANPAYIAQLRARRRQIEARKAVPPGG